MQAASRAGTVMLRRSFLLPHGGGPSAAAGTVLLAALQAAAATTAVERQAIEAAFARADLDGDSRLTRDEAQRFPETAARFDSLDRDHELELPQASLSIGMGASDGERPLVQRRQACLSTGRVVDTKESSS
jgi:hypothetical protein